MEWGLELQTQTKMDRVRWNKRQEDKKKYLRMGTIAPSCVVQMSDCVQASQYRPLGQALSGEAYWQDRGEQLCTGPGLCRWRLRCATNMYRSLFTLGCYLCIVLVCLLFEYMLLFDGLLWQTLFCMVIIMNFLCLAADGPPGVFWVTPQ